MGYYNEQTSNCEFFVAVKDVPAMRQAIVSCLGGENEWCAWTFDDEDVDSDGNLVGITMPIEYQDYQREVLDAIAPYVRAGSFVEIQGEDSADLFRLVWHESKTVKIDPEIIWHMPE